MHFQKNASVMTADGTVVGSVEQIVVDPSESDVTHLVVGESTHLSQDSLIPIDDVADTPEPDRIVLEAGVQLDEYDEFVPDHYEVVTTRPPLFGPPGFALYPLPDAPGTFVRWTPGRSAPVRETGGVPAGSGVITTGARVVTADGKSLGRVDEIVTDDEGEIEGMIATSGILWWKREWMVPVDWVEEIAGDGIHVSATKEEALDHAEDTPRWMTRADAE